MHSQSYDPAGAGYVATDHKLVNQVAATRHATAVKVLRDGGQLVNRWMSPVEGWSWDGDNVVLSDGSHPTLEIAGTETGEQLTFGGYGVLHKDYAAAKDSAARRVTEEFNALIGVELTADDVRKLVLRRVYGSGRRQRTTESSVPVHDGMRYKLIDGKKLVRNDMYVFDGEIIS